MDGEGEDEGEGALRVAGTWENRGLGVLGVIGAGRCGRRGVRALRCGVQRSGRL